VSNFSAYVSPEAAAQSAATTTWASGVSALAFDPSRGETVLAVAMFLCGKDWKCHPHI